MAGGKSYAGAGSSATYSSTLTSGFRVSTSGTSEVLTAGKESYGIAFDAINTKANNVLGRSITCGVDIKEGYTNGVDAISGTLGFTFGDTESVDSGISTAGETASIILTTTNGEERTYRIGKRVNSSATVTITDEDNIAVGEFGAGSVTITNYLHLLPDAVSATATVTITAFANLNTGDKVNLIATDGTNYDFVNGDQSSVAGTWESTTSNDDTATNLMNVINTSSGPSGSRFSATVDGAVITITQATVGLAGNTTVTLTDPLDGMSKTDFVNGIDGGGTHSVGIVAVDSTVITATSSNLTTTSSNTNSPTFMVVTDNDTTAVNLATCLDANSKISASAAGAVVTITQLVTGTAGNSTITLTDPATDGMTKVDFTGGLSPNTHLIGLIASDGTNVNVAAHRDTTSTTDTNTPTFAVDTASKDNTASALASCINANSKFSAVSAVNVVTITQLIGGSAGDTTITLIDPGDIGITKTNFTGGTGTALNKANGEFETGTTATETGDNFKNLVEDPVHGQAEFSVTNTAGVIVVSQDVGGVAGNTLARANGWVTICDVAPTTYFQNGADATRPNLTMQFSHTGNDWGGDLEIINDIEADVEGVKIGLANTTGIVAPFARLVVNQANTVINLVGQCETFYVYK